MFFVAVLLLVIGIICLKNKQITIAFFLMAFGIILILYLIVNTITSRKDINLSNVTMESISKIDWSDNNNLEKIGFEKTQFGYAFRDEFTVRLEKNDEIPENSFKYKNFNYDFHETRLGLLDINRLLYDVDVSRSYYIYVDDLRIYMFEESKENSPYVFEQIINRIYLAYKETQQ